MSKGKDKGKGFTFIELSLSIFLLLMLAASVLPGVVGLLRRAEVTRVNNELLAMLQAARYQAMARRQAVLLCAVSADGQCMGEWRERLVLFADTNQDQRLGEGDIVLHRSGPLPREIFLRWQSFRQQPYIAWNALGQTNASNGTLRLCHASGEAVLMRQIVINRAGRVRLLPYREGRGREGRGEEACR